MKVEQREKTKAKRDANKAAMGSASAAAAGNVASEDDEDEDYYDDYDQEYDDEYGDYGEEDGADIIATNNEVTEGNSVPDASNPATEATEEENGEIANEEIVIDTAQETPITTKNKVSKK